jgi:hypothetical protein
VWRATVPTAALLAVVLTVQFWPSGQDRQSRVTGTAESDSVCGKAILREWVSAGRIDGTYARSCYEAARRMLPEGGYLYGTGPLILALEEKLR